MLNNIFIYLNVFCVILNLGVFLYTLPSPYAYLNLSGALFNSFVVYILIAFKKE